MVFTVQYHPKKLLLVFGNTFVSNGFTCMEKLYVVFLSYQFCPENCRNRQETVGITGTVTELSVESTVFVTIKEFTAQYD